MKQSGRRSLGRFGDPGFAAIEETGPGPSDASRAQLFTPFLTTNRNSQSSCCALIRENLFHYAEAPRSSGSTLKPFIYGLGMEVKGYTAATLLTDTGLALDAHAGAYTFKNYDESFLGPILYRNALGNSRNIPAAQVLQAVGIDVAYRHLCDLGLIRVRENPARYGLGMSIGGLYVTLADLVRAYGILANDGRSFQLQWFPGQRPAHHTQLIQSDIARQITLFLSDPMARLPSFSRMGSLEYPFPVAVKTGTSKGYRDA